MSKRYGRQQKRKAREEIQKLSGQVRSAARSIEYFRSETQRLGQEIINAARILPKDTIVLPPKKYVVGHIEHGFERHVAVPESSYHRSFKEEVESSIERVVMFNSSLKDVHKQWDRMVHFVLTTSRGDLQYNLSYDAIDEIPADILAEYVLLALKPAIIKKINEAKRNA